MRPSRSSANSAQPCGAIPIALLLAAKEGKLTARLLPETTDKEGQGSVPLELSATDLNPIVLEVDPHDVADSQTVGTARTRRAARSSRSRSRTTAWSTASRSRFARRGNRDRCSSNAASPRSRSTRPSSPRCSTAQLLEPPPAAVVRRGVRRSLCRRAHARAARLDPSIGVAGLGGPQLAAAGGHLLDDYRELSVTGLVEWIPKLPRLLARDGAWSMRRAPSGRTRWC